MEEFNLKKEGLKILGGIVYLMVLSFIIKYFQLDIIGTYLLILASSIVLMLVSKTFKFKSLLVTSITLAGIFALMRFLGGVGGFFLSTAIICGIILIGRRKKYVKVKQHIESMIWGKPLKEFVKDGERPPKIQFKV